MAGALLKLSGTPAKATSFHCEKATLWYGTPVNVAPVVIQNEARRPKANATVKARPIRLPTCQNTTPS